MLARRLTLLTVFVGGCLSGATLIVFWRGEAPAVPSGEEPAVATQLRSRDEPAAEAPTEVPVAHVTTKRAPASAELSPPKDAPAPTLGDVTGTASPADAGSSVADVLASLEAAYRQKVAAAAPSAPPEPAPIADPTPSPAPAPAATAVVVAGRAPIAPPQPVAQAELVARRPEAQPPVTSDTAAAPAVAARDDARPTITVRDVHHTTYVNNVHQGDVVLMQQLALLQNIQLLALSPYARPTAPAFPVHTPRGTTRRAPPFATSLTNPDNPWGFDFPPTVLAK